MGLSSEALMRSEGTKPREWIPREWKSLFRGSAAMVTIPRRRLLHSVITAKHRWVNISGSPGSGRTTLLYQIADELDHRFRPHIMVTDSANESRSPSQILGLLRHDSDSGHDCPAGQPAAMEPQDYDAMLVDDFDYWLDDGRAEELKDAFRQSASLTVVTVTLNPLAPSAWVDDLAKDGESCFVAIRGSELAFTLDEVEALSQAIVEISPGLPPLGEYENEQIKSTTGGYPLAVGLAFDRWYTPEYGKLEGFNVELALQGMRRAYSMKYPSSLVDVGSTHVAILLSFMPRFDERHVRMLSRDVPDSSHYSVFDNPIVIGLQDSGGPSATGYAWKDSAWRVFLEWNESQRDVRKDLAHRLLDMEDYARAFDQMVLLQDLSAAEQLLAGHFMDVYEGFAPEIQEMLLGLSPAKLDRAPYLRLALAILNLELGDASSSRRPGVLAGSAETVSKGKYGKQAVIASAAIALRLGKTRDAYSRAERALAGAADAKGMFQAAQLMLRCGAMPDMPFPSLAEGRMISVNMALTETLIKKIAGESGELSAHKEALRFRALICSDEWLGREIAKWNLLDMMFGSKDADVPTMQERFGESPAYLGKLFACAKFLAVGNLPKAIDVADSGFVPGPARGIAQAVVYLASGQDHKLRDTLASIQSDGGQRTEALLDALRAASLNRQKMSEAVKPLLGKLTAMPLPLMAFALSVLPPADLAALLDLEPDIAQAAAIASRRGIVGLRTALPTHLDVVELTRREMEILRLLQQGLSDREISDTCYISLSTTKTHLQAIRKKLEVTGRRNIVARAQELHLL
jgi:DNA-binding CsgD family transcriptional regulator